MKIAITTDGIFPHSIGGIQRHSLNLIKHLSEFDGLELFVVHPHKETLFSDLDNVREFKIEDIDQNKLYLKECYEYSKRVHEVLKNLNCDVIYAQGITVWHEIDQYQDRLIVNPHGIEAFQARSFKDKLVAIPFKTIQRKLFRKARYVVTEGGHLTSYLVKASKDPSKVIYLPNATDKGISSFNSGKYESETTQCLFVARFASNKGIQVLMDAISILNTQGAENLNFKLAGKGPLFNEISAKYNSIRNISFLGFVSDEELETLYQESHVFIFPTLFEGMPTAIIEAMSYGLPVVASDTGAIPELVDDGNGFLIRPGDADQLAGALKDFSQLSKETKKSLSKNSLRKVKDSFNWRVVAKKHLDLFKNCS